jgi:hypothetical protein
MISSFSIYKNNEVIAIAGNIKPTKGTKIEGSNVFIILSPV